MATAPISLFWSRPRPSVCLANARFGHTFGLTRVRASRFLSGLGEIHMDMKRFALVAVAAVMLSACQTQYQEMGATGGVTAAPITNDTYRISSRGNGFTDPTTVQDYTLLKAAEVTLAAGGSHFLVVTSNDATSRSVGSTPGTFQTNVYGNTAFTTYNPGVNYDIVKPGQDLIIQVLKLPSGAASPPGSFDAQQVYNNINPRVMRPKK